MTKRPLRLAAAFFRSTNRPGVYDMVASAMFSDPSLVFQSGTGTGLSRNRWGRVLRRAVVASAARGFRWMARSWLADIGVPAGAAEASFARVQRSQVARACQRSDRLKGRAEVMRALSD